MTESINTQSTSNVSAKIDDRVLSQGATTRRVLRAELIRNQHNTDACVKVAIVHQRKSAKDDWSDIPAEPLTKMKAGDIMKLSLDTEETLKLREELNCLYDLYKEKGIPSGKRTLVVGDESEVIKTSSDRARLIKKMLDHNHAEELWSQLVEFNPDLAMTLCQTRIHHQRVAAVKEFEQAIVDGRKENYWQDFFEKHTWIFGYGLDYRILRTVQSQPNYGGTSLSGRGGQRGDFLVATDADVRFTVLAEIKTPDTRLLERECYRNGAFSPTMELSGGVSQVQANCHQWEIQGARTDENRDRLSRDSIHTIFPKGIIVIGHTNQLCGHDQRASFERYRRNTTNPEIITFDELFARAKFIVNHQASQVELTDEDRVAPQNAVFTMEF